MMKRIEFERTSKLVAKHDNPVTPPAESKEPAAR